MTSLTSRAAWLLSASLLLFGAMPASSASAQESACGGFDFDFSNGLNCKIEIEGGCKAQCTPVSFVAGCAGGCTATASQEMCVNPCAQSCLAECNPQLLDCFAGCHDECDAPVQAECETKNPEANCPEQAVAQCDIHCKESCAVPPTNCQEHCEECCTGGCNTVVNYDCDFQCFAELTGGCNVQCDAPDGALFCNGQYVNATSVKECITYLATQGVTVDASATAKATCGPDGCDVESLTGCSATNVGESGSGTGAALFLGMFGLFHLVRRRRDES